MQTPILPPGVQIRPTLVSDIPAVLDVFDAARAFMRRSGNLSQWGGGYPAEADVRRDIACGWSRVLTLDGRVAATFCMMTAPEPTYNIIDGAWPDDEPYFTLHRVASDGSVPGVFRMAVLYTLAHSNRIRVDTHLDNAPMLAAIAREGFVRCGVATMTDGTPREAFQLTAQAVVPHDRADERLPLVDEEGNVVGSATRGECHGGSMLLHPVVHLHVFDFEGRLFLQKRPDWKDIQPGKWDTAVGGHVDCGEDVTAALRREALEELGLEAFKAVPVCRYVFSSDRERELVNVFATVVPCDAVRPSAELDGGAFQSAGWIARAIADGAVTPNFATEYTGRILPFLRDGGLSSFAD